MSHIALVATAAQINAFHQNTVGPLVSALDSGAYNDQEIGVPFKSTLCGAQAVVMRTKTGYIGLVSHTESGTTSVVGDPLATDEDRARLMQSVLS